MTSSKHCCYEHRKREVLGFYSFGLESHTTECLGFPTSEQYVLGTGHQKFYFTVIPRRRKIGMMLNLIQSFLQ